MRRQRGIPVYDLTGNRYGHWTVLGLDRMVSGVDSFWRCACKCGVHKVVSGKSLRNNGTKSCGCRKPAITSRVKTIHGMCGSRIHHLWSAMRQRCENGNNGCFDRYGGRGISVCDRWQEFENFYADMGDPPSDQHTLERIDNEGDYAPENCRWATRIEQARNRRTTLWITFLGQEKSLAEWCDLLGLPYKTTWRRIRKYGFPVSEAFDRKYSVN